MVTATAFIYTIMSDQPVKLCQPEGFFAPPKGAILALLLSNLIAYGYFFQAGGHNANARFDQVRAIVEGHTLEITEFARGTADVIVLHDSVYPNKAPGLSLLGAAAWAFFHPLLSFIGSSSPALEELSCYLVCWATVGLASALLSICLYLVLLQCLRNPLWAMLLTLAYSLASIALPYSTLFFSHQLAAALLFASFTLLFFARRQLLRSNTAMFFSGLLLGYAGTSEYPSILAALPIAAYALLTLGIRRSFACFLAGGICGLGCLVIYNYAAFWNPFFIPYSVYQDLPQHSFAAHKLGFMGVSIPSLYVLKQITIMPMRGLFFCNPWLILLLPACFFVGGQKFRAERLLCFSIVVAFFCFNAGFGDSIMFWGGGAAIGTRHMLPMLPFAVVLISFVFQQRWIRYVFYPLAVISFAIMLCSTAVEPQVPYEYVNPISQLIVPGLLQSRFGLQYDGVFSFAPFEQGFAAFNLGKLAGIPKALQLLPLLLLLYYALRLLVVQAGGRSCLRSPAFRFASLVFLLLAFIPPAHAFSLGLRGVYNNGLLGYYYRGSWWPAPSVRLQEVIPPKEQLLKTVVDAQLVAPLADIDSPSLGPLSVEWRGYLEVPQAGSYVLAIDSDDGSAVYLNGKLVLNNWIVQHRHRAARELHLTAGIQHIVVRYFNETFGGSVTLYWRPPGQHIQPIPSQHLFASRPPHPRKPYYGVRSD